MLWTMCPSLPVEGPAQGLRVCEKSRLWNPLYLSAICCEERHGILGVTYDTSRKLWWRGRDVLTNRGFCGFVRAQGAQRSMIKSVAADLALGNLLDADSFQVDSPGAGPVRKTARVRGADETLAEPAATGASPYARVQRQDGPVFSGAHLLCSRSLTLAH